MVTRTLAFEIGTEELPAFPLQAATKQLGDIARRAFDASGISYIDIDIYSTPRRLIVVATGVPEATEAYEEVFRGPSAKIAFDADGNPTKAALGFARGKGVDAGSLQRRDENGVEYVYAVKSVESQRVSDLLPGLLSELITSVSWPKTQRWGSMDERFSRPVRWLFAMFGEDIVPVSYAGLSGSNLTWGHRFLSPGPFEVPCADLLISTLREHFVVPSESEREDIIRSQVAAVEADSGLVAELPDGTLKEVVNLTEYPTVMVGSFDELFLAVPKEITVDAMLVHQRYFPLFREDGSLSNKFIITSNGDARFESNIVDGNQRVVAARLYDAKFFYDEDLKKPLESYVDGLAEMTFQESLGSMLSKAKRIQRLAGSFAVEAGLSEDDVADAERAGYLAKADLTTQAVFEFTAVQGIMGSYYALASGESEQVARAISDHYRPRFSGDDLPSSDVGKVVAMADKIDTICGLFAVGQGPTGSSDPFALRRSAIGIIAMLEAGLPVSLSDAVDASLATYGDAGVAFDIEDVRAEIIDFFVTRTKVILRDRGNAPDAIDAVLATGVVEPSEIIMRVDALEAARAYEAETFDNLAIAYARANNLRDEQVGVDFDEAMLTEVEHALTSAITQAESKVALALGSGDYASALSELAALRAPIDLFFDRTMIMDEDVEVRVNRMRVLNRFVSVFANVADFGKMAKSK